MITIENKSNVIEMFGRKENGTFYKKEDHSFRPYFYIKNTRGEFKTITGDRVSKVICNDPREVKEKRELYTHFEADILYTNRYLIDRVNKIDKEPIRVCYLDIELRQNDGFSSITDAKNPISLIGVYDSFDKRHKQFSLKEFEKNGGEGIMLSAFIQYIQDTNPDIIASWFGNGFDFPYLLNRMKKLGINISRLGRGGYSYSGTRCKIYGRILFDMLEAYKKHFSSGGRESWSLDYVSKYELGEDFGKEEYEGTLDELEEKHFKKFLDYNKRDVQLLVELDNHLKMVDFFDEIRRMAFCKFEDVFMNSKTADCLCLKQAKGNVVLPSVSPKQGDKYMGGYVIECNPKLYENIVVMDFRSLYPSIMIGFNTSYETLSPTGEINVDDKYRFTRETGIIPSIVKPLLERRRATKVKMGKLDGRTLEYKSLDITQKALKVITNSFYGVLGYRNFRLYNREVASAITYIAQKILKETIKWFNDNGYPVIYGDTDSVFIQMEDRDINKINKINEEINKYLNKYLKKYVDDKNNIFKIEFNEAFAVLFFKRKDDGSGAKKKYAGKLYWKNGIKTKEVAIVGFESRRSDYPAVGRDFLKKILHMVLDKEPPERVMKFVEDFKEKIRGGHFKPEELAFPIGINKALDQYGNVMHIRACRLANKLHNENIKSGDKVKYIFIKGENDVIAFKEKMPKGYKLDYDNIIRRIVNLKIEPIFRSLNWRYNNDQIIKKWNQMKLY
ncbi:MAG: ribonuclease H-like domain-containing protein [Bacteroidetes bacterium]|nr:ribonuclease H-like domain-containing protein [Bacteroidota bacterium]